MHTTPSSRDSNASIGTDPKESSTTFYSFKGEEKAPGFCTLGDAGFLAPIASLPPTPPSPSPLSKTLPSDSYAF